MMEKRKVVMCGVLSLLGLLSAVTAFAAEATRIKVSLSLYLSLVLVFLSRILFFGVIIFNRRLLKLSHKVGVFFLINDSSKLIGCLPRVFFLGSNFCCVFDCFLPIFFF